MVEGLIYRKQESTLSHTFSPGLAILTIPSGGVVCILVLV